ADSGDRHAETLFNFITAIDRSGEPMRESGSFIGSMAPGLRADPWAWLGKSLSIYADQDPFWDDLEKSTEPDQFLQKDVQRLPLALRVEVADSLKLTVFLTALRGFVDGSAPGMTVWETLDADGKPYVKISAGEHGKQELGEMSELKIYYAATPKSLLVT